MNKKINIDKAVRIRYKLNAAGIEKFDSDEITYIGYCFIADHIRLLEYTEKDPITWEYII